MKSVETQTELLECSADEGASSEDAASVIDDELDMIPVRHLEVDPGQEQSAFDTTNKNEASDDDADTVDDMHDVDEEDIMGEDTKLKSIKRLNCSNLFNFNKLELLNERCSVASQQQITDSSRNLCDHEMHIAVDEDLAAASHLADLMTSGEGKRTLEDVASSSSAIFIQESPEVIL